MADGTARPMEPPSKEMPAPDSFLVFARKLWNLIAPYWRSEEKTVAWALLLVIVALTLGLVYMNVLFNHWYNGFYNSLQYKDAQAFFASMLRFCVLAAIWIAIVVYASYLNQMLQIRWRRWLTDVYLAAWLRDRVYYRMQLAGNHSDNPDQRIAEDFKLFVDDTLYLALGFLNSAVTFISFVGILWSLSGPITLTVGDSQITIQGYMVWACFGYALLGTWFAHVLGKPLIPLNFSQRRFEADFRFNLGRFRESTEGVALYHGEEDELRGFREHFAHVVKNWRQLMERQRRLAWFTYGYGQVAVVFPYLVAAPRYFSGAIELGGLMQVGNAFGQVQGALSWFVNAYTSFASWRATVDRLLGFQQAMQQAASEQHARSGPTITAHEEDQVTLDGIQLALPQGRPVVSAQALSIFPKEHVLIRGPTGSGKSTLFRAVAGIWPFGKGRVLTPRDFRAMFLPQRPYFPLGTLRRAVSYPSASARFTDDQLREALQAVGLTPLTEHLDETRQWGQQLSGGEQQRFAFARVILHQPHWVFLDEATSNLDDRAQSDMYELLRTRLDHATIVSIGHRANLEAFHDRVIQMKPGPGGCASLQPADA